MALPATVFDPDRCSVCGGALASVDVRDSPHRIWPKEWGMVERTTVCESDHRVIRLWKAGKTH
jgi:hypothetical protein